VRAEVLCYSVSKRLERDHHQLCHRNFVSVVSRCTVYQDVFENGRGIERTKLRLTVIL
jgi:hypothetical protein